MWTKLGNSIYSHSSWIKKKADITKLPKSHFWRTHPNTSSRSSLSISRKSEEAAFLSEEREKANRVLSAISTWRSHRRSYRQLRYRRLILCLPHHFRISLNLFTLSIFVIAANQILETLNVWKFWFFCFPLIFIFRIANPGE